MTRYPLALFLILFLPTATFPADAPRPTNDPEAVIHGAAVGQAKSGRDTTLLMGPTGSGAPRIGDFEGGSKAFPDPADPNPPYHGWSSVDLTRPTVTHWQVATYRAVSGAYSAWCGDLTFPSCDGGVSDPVGGYGNLWHDLLEWRQVVDDPGAAATLTITALANIDCEPGYDFVTLLVEKSAQDLIEVARWDGVQPGLAVGETVTYQPGEYVGPGADEVVVVWRFRSDGLWSDEDCSYPSGGAIQLDDVTITSDNGEGTGGVVDFEDGTLNPFRTRLPQGVGDFAQIWSGLEDLDPCRTNHSHQVAFIDDGVVVPGTGSTDCDTWCYGPAGKIVNYSGGLVGPADHIHNAIVSPVMTWADPTHRGARLTFGVYRHEDLSADAPGIFYTWHVRSAAAGGIAAAPWKSRNFIYWGGPDYLRHTEVVDDLLVTAPEEVQIRLAVHELGWVWGWNGHDGYPAPYFDNVRLETFPVAGPGLTTRTIDLAQDGFPESGTLDLADPGDLWVRFDMAQNISPPSHGRRDFGDSVVLDCVVTRPDAVLDGPPVMHYRVDPNPVFDPYRVGFAAAGAVPCGQVTGPTGAVVPNRWFADLPDTAFLFPGDVVHYYIEASDVDTLTSSVETAIMPADTSGYSDFAGGFENYRVFDYDPSFTMRALPTIANVVYGDQPGALFWNDFGVHGRRDDWFMSFAQLDFRLGQDFDVYHTQGPGSGVGNGLGGRATAEQLAGYDVLLYSAGDLGRATISNGDLSGDSSRDVQVLTAWLDSGYRGAFLAGDNLVSDLVGSGPAGFAFVRDMMNVAHVAADVRPLIDGQTAPRVLATPANPVFVIPEWDHWIAYGGCPGIARFDAVEVSGVGQRIAVFANASGVDGGYPYAAATLAAGVGAAGTSEVVSIPYGFASIRKEPGHYPNFMFERTRFLRQVLGRWCWIWPPPDPSDVPDAAAPLSARCVPNPFNATTTVRYHAPRAGELTLKIYDVRGALVRTLVDGPVPAGAGEIAWTGRDDRGRGVASGVYFYEARLGGEVRIGKIALVK